MENIFGFKWIKIRSELIKYYTNVAIYKKSSNGMVKYKNAGQPFTKDYIPENLYISHEDRALAHKELSEGFNKTLLRSIESNEVGKLEFELLKIANEILADPRHGSVLPATEITKTIIDNYFENKISLEVFKTLVITDYTTVTHAMHVMALTIQYAKYKDLDFEETTKLATGAMLHDVGKYLLNDRILSGKQDLTDYEISEIRKHPIYGYNVLKENNLDYYAEIALKHHERINGSGYPNKIRDFDKDIQLIGIIDAYEAMTSDYRIYSNVKSPYDALKELRRDVDSGAFEMGLYSDFVRSLSGVI